MRDLPRGTVSLLFTDIEGSTKLLQHLGERYQEVLVDHRRLLRTACDAHGGVEVDTQGDAFFYAFARAADAVSAAVDAQRALASHPWELESPVRVRVGIHSGTPTATDEGYVGIDVHRAARVMSAGHGGQVLLSGATVRELGEWRPTGVTVADLGEHRLKDLVHPERLFQAVIDGLPSDFPALKTLGAHPNNLPLQPTPLIGREPDLGELAELLARDDVRLVTVTGVGGTGKTRLALQLAAELLETFRSGAFFVDLAPLSDASLVTATIAQTLGVREAPGQTLAETVSEYLQDKEMLLALDNFEHVVEAAGDVAQLLSVCSELKVIATSRERLRIPWEREYILEPLPVPSRRDGASVAALARFDAVALFVERAQEVKHDFRLTAENAESVVDICRRLDGLPLAIELAAARVRVLDPDALSARLERRLQLLTGGARSAAERQQTLRATIDWSYRLLDEEEQTVFARLSIFAGGCSLEAMEAVCDGDLQRPAIDDVFALVEKNLLRTAAEADGRPRVAMLETIREFAGEQLAARSDGDEVHRRHADHFLALAERRDEAFKGSTEDQTRWLDQVELEYGNFRAAFGWALGNDVETAARMANALATFLDTRGRWSDARAWLEAVLDRAEQLPPALLAATLRSCGWVAVLQSDYDAAMQRLDDSASVCRREDDLAGTAKALWQLAIVIFTRDHDLARATHAFEEALALADQIDDEHLAAGIHSSMGYVYGESGDYARALELTQGAYEVFARLGDESWMNSLRNNLGWCSLLLGDYEHATALLEETYAWASQMGDPFWTAQAAANLAYVSLFGGDDETAHDLLIEALTLLEPLGEIRTTAEYLRACAAVAAVRGATGDAAQLAGASDALHQRSRDPTSAVERVLDERFLVVAAAADPGWSDRRERGSTMSRDEAIAFALALAKPRPSLSRP